MSLTARLRINDVPIGKGRPRAAVVNGQARVYTPQKTAEWEAAAAVELRAQWLDRKRLNRDYEVITTPCTVVIYARFPRPKNKVWKRKPMPPYPHVTKPDADNVIKCVLDSLQRAGVIQDDSLVYAVKCEKMVCMGDQQPHVDILLHWEE